MAKQNKEYVYVDCYQCDENGKSSPWKRKHLDDVPKWQHEEAKDFNCFRVHDIKCGFFRGGNWNNTSNAGVFYLNGNNPRSNSNDNIGFRPA